MDPILLQKQLRDNTNDLQDFCKELKEWSTDMKRKEESLNGDEDSSEKVVNARCTQVHKLLVLFQNQLYCRQPIKSGSRRVTLVQEMRQMCHENRTKSKGLITRPGKSLMLRENVKKLINTVVIPNLPMSTMRV